MSLSLGVTSVSLDRTVYVVAMGVHVQLRQVVCSVLAGQSIDDYQAEKEAKRRFLVRKVSSKGSIGRPGVKLYQ